MVFTRERRPPAQVQIARNRFESWRKIKQGRERIPEPLWAAAVKLCERYSAHRVSRWLRLNSAALRHRLNGNHPPGCHDDKAVQQAVLRSKRRAPAFVEWVATPPASMAPSAAEYVLELEGAQGPSLRLRVRGAKVMEVAQLTSLLRREHE